MTDLERRVGEALAALGVANGGAVVAVSGGPDSVALLDLVHRLAPARGLRLTVAHFDHGIHPDSAAVAAAVAALADARGLPRRIGGTSLGAGATETEARRHRLRWLESVRASVSARWILTAHHRDDQVETVLMRVLRGSGVAGLAGIPARRGPWRRPLLGISRAELAGYLSRNGLEAWADPANRDPRHLRSWIRGEVLPLLEARVPEVADHLLRTAAAAAADRRGWDQLLDQLPGLDFQAEGDGASVAAVPLAGYSSAVVRGLVAALGRRLGWALGSVRVGRIQTLLEQGISGRRVELFAGRLATLEQGRFRLYRAPAHLTYRMPVGPGRIESVPGWLFEGRSDRAPVRLDRNGYVTWFAEGTPLEVRSWQPGDRMVPLGATGHRMVVRCMQDSKVPRHRRPGWPVFVSGGAVVWVPGVCRSGAALPIPGTEAMRVDARAR